MYDQRSIMLALVATAINTLQSPSSLEYCGGSTSRTPQTANPDLVSVPDPKPTPAQIAFSCTRGEGKVW